MQKIASPLFLFLCLLCTHSGSKVLSSLIFTCQNWIIVSYSAMVFNTRQQSSIDHRFRQTSKCVCKKQMTLPLGTVFVGLWLLSYEELDGIFEISNELCNPSSSYHSSCRPKSRIEGTIHSDITFDLFFCKCRNISSIVMQ